MKLFTLDEYAGLDSPVHRLDARAKILAFVTLLIISVTTPPSAYAAFAGYLLMLIAAIAAARVPLRFVAKRSLVIIPFALLVTIFLPFMNHGARPGDIILRWRAIHISKSGLTTLWSVSVRAYLGVVCLITMSSVTPFPKLLQGLEQLHAPKLVTLQVSFLYRYLFVLADEAARMSRAALARGYRARWIWRAGVVGHLIGTLFLRSYERGERVYLAMAARGFTGNPVGFGKTPFRARDAAFLTVVVGLALFLRIWS